MKENKEPYVGMPINLDGYELLIDDMQEDPACICDSDFNNWPLAMAYVPMQPWEDPYPMEKGFQVGTIFEGLDLPFKGGMKR